MTLLSRENTGPFGTGVSTRSSRRRTKAVFPSSVLPSLMHHSLPMGGSSSDAMDPAHHRPSASTAPSLIRTYSSRLGSSCRMLAMSFSVPVSSESRARPRLVCTARTSVRSATTCNLVTGSSKVYVCLPSHPLPNGILYSNLFFMSTKKNVSSLARYNGLSPRPEPDGSHSVAQYFFILNRPSRMMFGVYRLV